MRPTQLALFGPARSTGTGGYCLACITEHALWRGTGQLYYDARRWASGEAVQLSEAQEAYLMASRPGGGHPVDGSPHWTPPRQ